MIPFLNLFRKPSPIPDLRDRLVAAEVQLVLLRDLINRAPRKGREMRCDAKSFISAKDAMTERLKEELKDKANLPLAEAIEATRSLSRSEGV